MSILLQSVATQFCRLFDIFPIAKHNKVTLLQSVTDCYYKLRRVLQSVIDCCYKVRQVLQGATDCYYKLHQVLQSVTDFITKCVRYYKWRRNSFSIPAPCLNTATAHAFIAVILFFPFSFFPPLYLYSFIAFSLISFSLILSSSTLPKYVYSFQPPSLLYYSGALFLQI